MNPKRLIKILLESSVEIHRSEIDTIVKKVCGLTHNEVHVLIDEIYQEHWDSLDKEKNK